MRISKQKWYEPNVYLFISCSALAFSFLTLPAMRSQKRAVNHEITHTSHLVAAVASHRAHNGLTVSHDTVGGRLDVALGLGGGGLCFALGMLLLAIARHRVGSDGVADLISMLARRPGETTTAMKNTRVGRAYRLFHGALGRLVLAVGLAAEQGVNDALDALYDGDDVPGITGHHVGNGAGHIGERVWFG